MSEIQAPGVRIQHVLTEPARVLRTGVPVFLGLVSAAAIREWNAAQTDPNEQFICVPFAPQSGQPSSKLGPAPDPCGCDDANLPAIVRKRGYLELPGRVASPAREGQIGDRSASDPSIYMRVPQSARRLSTEYDRGIYRSKVQASAGSAGPLPPYTRALAGDSGQAEPGVPDLRALSRKPQRFTIWPQFRLNYSGVEVAAFLPYVVRGFFENGGTLCYVQLIAYKSAADDALRMGLDSLAPYDDYDLVCVPDLLWEDGLREDLDRVVDLQNEVMHHCNALGDRLAILDALPVGNEQIQRVVDQRFGLLGALGTGGTAPGANAALYYPWVRVPGGPEQTSGYVPPCGHVAGIYARTDQRIGAHKAPANEVIEGVIDLAAHLSDDEQAPLNDAGINCLRAFPRRGIRVWGARTLSRDATWRYVNVRRVILTAVRWITVNMNDVVYEPHTEQLWARITRELTAYFDDLARRGALAGGTDQQAFYVKCDAETNPPEVRETGRVITEIGLRPAAPAEFIVIRIIHGPTGVEITTE
jgi:hypothetical protein